MTIPVCEIELTNRCNANCIMCPRGELERPFGEMDEKTLRLIVDKAAGYGVDTITFSGFGEPLLNKNAPDYVKYVKEKGLKIKTNITTNAGLLSRKLSEKLIQAGLDEIQISFNGWDKDSYERIMRGLKFESITENIKSLIIIKA